MNQLKFLSNELRMPVVALGTSVALYAMQADPQIASRFEPFALPRWHESAALREFVVSFGRCFLCTSLHRSAIRQSFRSSWSTAAD